MAEMPAHAPGDPASARARVPSKREAHLLELAADVEGDDPVLACELRGMALHEAGLAPAEPLPQPALWRRLARRWAPQPGWR
jgi:hypothetical protein